MAFENLDFCYPWRSYQKRVLEELEVYFGDSHLHVVAAPGSGKTVLGLEVMRRRARPALVLAPSLAIRNQWVNRLEELFLPADADISWISKSIYEPAVLTVTTYQALHAAWVGRKSSRPEVKDGEDALYSEQEEGDRATSVPSPGRSVEVLERLRLAGVGTLVLDEAHHLRSEWWKVLISTKEGLEKVAVVALTATPPYDVESTEWQRYQELCGPIDSLISVPELVKQGDLCPHQDYIYFSTPTKLEREQLQSFREATTGLASRLKNNQAFVQAVRSHPWIRGTSNHVREILEEPAFFSSLLIFLHDVQLEVPVHALELLGASIENIPELDVERLEALLEAFLYKRVEEFPETDELREEMTGDLKRAGALERRRVQLKTPRSLQKLLSSSLGKLDSIVDIAAMEEESLGQELRMVILTDFIREDYMPAKSGESLPLNKIGVVPIFEYLRRAEHAGVRLGILTGSLVVIPADSEETLRSIASDQHLDLGSIRLRPLPHDAGYLEVVLSGQGKQERVRLITELFTRGGVTTMVGTQALLGEGWDAPVLNTLVLASFVGSYMLSNQMRGRAIRTLQGQPGKTANIWHLAAIDDTSELGGFNAPDSSGTTADQGRLGSRNWELGPDVETLERRFRSFEGLSFDGEPATIESGLGRIGISPGPWNSPATRAVNEKMLHLAADRSRLRDLWNESLRTGKSMQGRLWEQVDAQLPRQAFYWSKTAGFLLKSFVVSSIIGAALFFTVFLRAICCPPVKSNDLLIPIGIVSLIVGPLYYLVIHGPRILCIYLFTGTVEGHLHLVGKAVLESLHEAGRIRTDLSRLKIIVKHGRKSTLGIKSGAYSCRLSGATHREEKSFLQAFEEVVSFVDNPRYLLVRTSRFLFKKRKDYHAVPTALTGKKKTATLFQEKFSRYVDPCVLVFTRNQKGRKILLKARTSAMSSVFETATDRRRVWE
ncbi:MAG: restriction endonuclease subunit R [Planctomycetaceae bacterium]|nr:restriction endonuclease subunit R [Planctomycetaceae bacterium]